MSEERVAAGIAYLVVVNDFEKEKERTGLDVEEALYCLARLIDGDLAAVSKQRQRQRVKERKKRTRRIGVRQVLKGNEKLSDLYEYCNRLLD